MLAEAKMVSKKKKLVLLLATLLVMICRRWQRTLWSHLWVLDGYNKVPLTVCVRNWRQRMYSTVPSFANFVFACLYPEQFHNHLPPHFHQHFFLCWGPKIPHCKQYACDWKLLSDWLCQRVVVVGHHGHVHIIDIQLVRVYVYGSHLPTDANGHWLQWPMIQQVELILADEPWHVGPVTLPDYRWFSRLISSGCGPLGNVSYTLQL